MRSGNFSHVSSSTLYKKSESIEWDFNSKDNHSSFYIDGDVLKGIHEAGDGKRKFLWGLESRHFNQGFAGIVRDNLGLVLNTFEAIFTYDDNLIKLSPKFKEDFSRELSSNFSGTKATKDNSQANRSYSQVF